MKKLLLYFLLFALASCGQKRMRMSSTSMEGTIHKDETVFVHTTKKVERNDIAVFKHHDGDKEEKWVFRVVGMPGDKIELKEGKVYVNGEKFREPATLRLEYRAFVNEPLNQKFLDQYEFAIVDETQYMFFLTDSEKVQVKNNPVIKEIEPAVMSPLMYEDFIFIADSINKWNVDNFGPLTVPEASYFLLGDNRHNAADSRFNGFVKAEDIVGVVELNKDLVDVVTSVLKPEEKK